MRNTLTSARISIPLSFFNRTADSYEGLFSEKVRKSHVLFVRGLVENGVVFFARLIK